MVNIFFMINDFIQMEKNMDMETTKTAMVTNENLYMNLIFHHARQRGDSQLRHRGFQGDLRLRQRLREPQVVARGGPIPP